jgi:hypothetical protein
MNFGSLHLPSVLVTALVLVGAFVLLRFGYKALKG